MRCPYCQDAVGKTALTELDEHQRKQRQFIMAVFDSARRAGIGVEVSSGRSATLEDALRKVHQMETHLVAIHRRHLGP